MRDETLDRLHLTVQVLRDAYPGRITYQELSRRIAEATREKGPAKRTMIRDLERLERQGFDIHLEMDGRHQTISLAPDQRQQATPISDIQLLALSLAQEMMEPLRGTVFWNGIRTFWNETTRTAPQETRRHFRRRRRQVIVRGTPAKSYSAKGGILSTIYDAQLNHREVEIDYTKPDNSSGTRAIRPYALAFHEGSIYVVAEDAAKQAMRTFKLDRIERAQRLDSFFRPKADFDVGEYFAESLSVFGAQQSSREKAKRITARIRNPKALAFLSEKPIHPDQEITLKDGEPILTIPAVRESEFIRDILAYQDEIEILSPASCRTKMRKTLQRMLSAYE